MFYLIYYVYLFLNTNNKSVNKKINIMSILQDFIQIKESLEIKYY